MSTSRTMNRFSTHHAAGADTFVGYSAQSMQMPGAWRPDEIAMCWQQCDEGPPSFWVVGERKLGKTSLLLRLEHLVMRPARDARKILPLYVNCTRLTTLADFYRSLCERALSLLAPPQGSPQSFQQSGLELARAGAGSAFDLLDAAVHDLGTLVTRLSTPDAPRPRVVLLLDDLAAVGGRDWAATLFDHLRTLIRGGPWPRTDGAARSGDVALAIASDRSLERVAGARSLLEIVEELPLQPFGRGDVAAMVADQGQSPIFSEWACRATGGHPWLMQFVMERVAAALSHDGDPEERELDRMVLAAFHSLEEAPAIFQRYLDSLPAGGVQVLAHLALAARDGAAVKTLVAKTKMKTRDVVRILEQMLQLGIAHHMQPGEAQDRETRYFVGEIFRTWFLSHTGGSVFMEEVEELRAAADRERTQIVNVPFTLTLCTDPEFLLADGPYTRAVPLDRNFAKTLNHIRKLTLEEARKDLIEVITDHVDQALNRDAWASVWTDYVKAQAEGREPRFVFRVGNIELFQFPIELLSFGTEPLGLERPVYKELMAGPQYKPAYRLSRQFLPDDEDVNVLIVGSSRGGSTAHGSFPDLAQVDLEVAKVAEILRKPGPNATFRTGRILALTHQEIRLADGVDGNVLSPETFANALHGELGTKFHIVHYCGHYTPNRNEESGGFLIHDGRELQLFNLAQWSNALKATTLRLVCLSACSSAGHEEDASLYQLGAAHTALTAGAAVFIGMRWPIKDHQGHDFSLEFYPQLLRHGAPEEALFHTRRALSAKKGAGTLWAAPVMLTR